MLESTGIIVVVRAVDRQGLGRWRPFESKGRRTLSQKSPNSIRGWTSSFLRVANKIRLSCGGHPWRSPASHGVQLQQQLAHHCHQGHVAGFPTLTQVLVEATQLAIDVSKERLDVAVRPNGDSWGVGYDQPGVEQLATELAVLGPAVVVLEATGGLEVPLVAELAATGLPVVVVNPRQVRDF